MKILVFRDVMTCTLLDSYQCCRGTCCLSVQGTKVFLGTFVSIKVYNIASLRVEYHIKSLTLKVTVSAHPSVSYIFNIRGMHFWIWLPHKSIKFLCFWSIRLMAKAFSGSLQCSISSTNVWKKMLKYHFRVGRNLLNEA